MVFILCWSFVIKMFVTFYRSRCCGCCMMYHKLHETVQPFLVKSNKQGFIGKKMYLFVYLMYHFEVNQSKKNSMGLSFAVHTLCVRCQNVDYFYYRPDGCCIINSSWNLLSSSQVYKSQVKRYTLFFIRTIS